MNKLFVVVFFIIFVSIPASMIVMMVYGVTEPGGSMPPIALVFIIIPIAFIVLGVIACVGTLKGSNNVEKVSTYEEIIDEGISVAKTTPLGGSTGLDLDSIPEKCPSCGAPLTISDLVWSGPLTAECPYCGYVIKVKVK